MKNPSALIRSSSVAVLLAILVSGCVAAPEVAPGSEYGNQLGAVQYTIKPGDNLVLVAAEQTRASENWRRIADFNRIQNPASIKVGQVIWIPNDLIPLTANQAGTREVAGHPDAIVNSVKLPPRIKPVVQ